MTKKKQKTPPKQKNKKSPPKEKPIKKKKSATKAVKPGRSKIKSNPTKKTTPVKSKKGVKRVIRRSKPISRELKNFLKDQGITKREYEKQSRKIQKEYEREFRETQPQQGRAGEWYYPNTKALKADYRNFKVASYRHNSYESALKWWKGVTGGAEYFVILRKKSSKTGQELFFVMDIDPNRRRKGTSKKVADYQSDRALKLEAKYREAEDIE